MKTPKNAPTLSKPTPSLEQIESILQQTHTIHDLENNSSFNVFCKLSEALDTAHNSCEVSSFQKQDIQDSISKLNSEILSNAVENLDSDQLVEYFLYDEDDHKSLLIEHISETCYRV